MFRYMHTCLDLDTCFDIGRKKISIVEKTPSRPTDYNLELNRESILAVMRRFRTCFEYSRFYLN